MVHFSTTTLVFAALISTGFAIPTRRDVSQVDNDISNIGLAVENLNTVIASIAANGTVGAAGSSDLRSAVIGVENATTVATNDLKNTSPLSDADADTLIQVLQPVAQDVVDTLGELVNTKNVFDSAGGDPAILLGLQELQSDTSDFQAALNAVIPADLNQTVDGINGQVNNAFESALEAFGDENN
ncbi:hypothetical protein PILCRDRAFT_272718 [Piloderma croceum F 1598]|uniref:Hydrophobic surface binding protein n=1 Tax=Piloderma croceum (strain F 1598) TaxID=765440 RepID=A0A0C3G6B6_PILCF|nr:hypothetical protein PILCRDRAFT_272718 [Piloderma croceum F 1598]